MEPHLVHNHLPVSTIHLLAFIWPQAIGQVQCYLCPSYYDLLFLHIHVPTFQAVCVFPHFCITSLTSYRTMATLGNRVSFAAVIAVICCLFFLSHQQSLGMVFMVWACLSNTFIYCLQKLNPSIRTCTAPIPSLNLSLGYLFHLWVLLHFLHIVCMVYKTSQGATSRTTFFVSMLGVTNKAGSIVGIDTVVQVVQLVWTPIISTWTLTYLDVIPNWYCSFNWMSCDNISDHWSSW